MQAKVSLVVACYNKVDYIGEFFQSVYDQKWDNIELILVNDGSTDGTRDAIYAWESKFKRRGYEVIIVDQKNMGVTVAYKVGIGRITGDYICFADCDDLLHCEYVSAMMEPFLKNNKLDMVFCGSGTGLYFEEQSMDLFYSEPDGGLRAKNMLDIYLCGRANYALWAIMVSGRFFFRCRVYENYSTASRVSQEQSVLISLFYNNPLFDIVDRPLYTYLQRANSQSYACDYATARRNCEGLFFLCEDMIRRLDAPIQEKEKLFFLSRYYYMWPLLLYSRKFLINDIENTEIFEYARSLLRLLPTQNQKFEDPLLTAGVDAVFRAVTNGILGHRNSTIESIQKKIPSEKIIGYGTGRVANRLLPHIRNTPLCPGEFWDRSAEGGNTFMDIPVYKPNFDKLNSETLVIVFLKSQKVINEVKTSLSNTPTTVIYYHDVLDYLADYYFPLQAD